MDIGTILWGLWIIAFLIIEGIAIWRNDYDTLSEKIWKVSAKHKVFRALLVVTLIWVCIHLVGGPCALGIC